MLQRIETLMKIYPRLKRSNNHCVLNNILAISGIVRRAFQSNPENSQKQEICQQPTFLF